MGCNVIFRALLVRVLFACHGLLAIWLLFNTTKDSRAWYIAVALGGLVLETLVTMFKQQGKEWKWFCPSVFFYLLSVVPAIWFLELEELEKRIDLRDNVNTTRALTNQSGGLTFNLENLWEFRINLNLTSDQWVRTIEQVLLLLLILGRWMLPKGKLTHDQLSQLLLVYIGTAADIVEFFDAFKEEEVRYNRLLCKVILAIWSWSLLQFTMVLTATKARKDQSGVLSRPKNDGRNTCCTPDVYGIIISIFMQDAPFLTLRLLLIFRYKVVSYTNMFFTCKNTLVILLLMYRLIVVQIERRKDRGRSQEYMHMSESNSGAKLMHGYSENYERIRTAYANHYKPAPTRPEPEYEDIPVNFTIKKHISNDNINSLA